MAERKKDRFSALERALPFAAIAETIFTKGKSAGTTSLAQLDRIDQQRFQGRQEDRQDRLDQRKVGIEDSNAITRQLQQDQLRGRIGDAQTKADLIKENNMFDDSLRKRQKDGDLGLTFSNPSEKVAFNRSPLEFINNSVLGKTQSGKIDVAEATAGIKADQPRELLQVELLEKKIENVRTPEQLAAIAAQKQEAAAAARLGAAEEKEALNQARLGRSIKGLEPIQGITLTNDSIKKAKEGFKSFKIIDGLMKQLQSDFGQHGGEILMGKAKARMQALSGDVKLELKELVNLGVLNGPDLAILQEQIPDPTSVSANIERSLAGIIGGGDPIQSKFDTFQENLRRKLDAGLSVHGFTFGGGEQDSLDAQLDALGVGQ